jgi:glutaredoxin
MTTVVLYGRRDCCLCDDARAVIERARTRHAFLLQERDIEADDSLMLAYLERIPVITIDGEEAFALFVDADELERRLEAAASPPVK